MNTKLHYVAIHRKLFARKKPNCFFYSYSVLLLNIWNDSTVRGPLLINAVVKSFRQVFLSVFSSHCLAHVLSIDH